MKEGMYVRTKYSSRCNIVAIRKIDEIDKDDNEMRLDADVVDAYGDFYNNVYEQDIEIASENIVDVLKPGDYVNSERVQYKTYSRQLISDGGYDILKKYQGIKTIVTKEQFESMKYEVKKDE